MEDTESTEGMPSPGASVRDSERASQEQDLVHGQATVEAEFHSERLARPFRRALDEDVTIDVESVVRLPDGRNAQYWRVVGSTPEALLTVGDKFPTTVDARLVSTIGDTHRIEVVACERSLFGTVDEYDGTPQSAWYDEDGVSITVEFPSSVDLDRVLRDLRDIYGDFDVVSTRQVVTNDVVRHLVTDALTERQLTALRMAYFGGYFEQPRQSTGAELAARMGITKQAFHEHLRKAYRKVFEQVLETPADAEALDS
jgi:predicted DNA binding protein